MRRRRRYEVVVEGVSGHAASQRSVISEHRSEADARENAAHERARLEVIYGEGAVAWRILVVRDDEVIAEERPNGVPEERSSPRILPDEAEPAAEEGPGDEAPAAPRTPPQEWPDMDISGPVPEWVISRVEESIARRRGRERDAGGPDDGAGDADA